MSDVSGFRANIDCINQLKKVDFLPRRSQKVPSPPFSFLEGFLLVAPYFCTLDYITTAARLIMDHV